jgi:hypothetical protein
MNRLSLIAFAFAVMVAGCGSKKVYISGTKVPYSQNNESALKAVEEYRLAVERADIDSLVLMAHPQYWEDSGTPSGSDDYGYEGLKNVLVNRLSKATDIRYTLRYMGVAQQCKSLQPGCRATVDVLIDASFTIPNVQGKPSRPDKRDQNQLLLEWNGKRWMFIQGM